MYQEVEEIKQTLNSMITNLRNKIRYNDPIIKFIEKDHVGINKPDFGMRILPLQLIDQYGPETLQIEKEYLKRYKPDYNYYDKMWYSHFILYWKDKVELLKKYTGQVEELKSPLEIYNDINDLMIKIERRSCLLNPEPRYVEQKHQRVSGDTKEYKFIRSYWVDDNGHKKRMISRMVGNKFNHLEEEVGNLFHSLQFAVHRSYRYVSGDSSTVFDLVIERENYKLVIELKDTKNNESKFNSLFMFDELLNRFREEYPNG